MNLRSNLSSSPAPVSAVSWALQLPRVGNGTRSLIWPVPFSGQVSITASCALWLRRPVLREGVKLRDGGSTCVSPAQVCRQLGAEFVIASDVWDWSSLMRSIGLSPQRAPRAYPSNYRVALAQTDIHIQPRIPLAGHFAGKSAVDRMIAVGELAARRGR